MNHPKLLYFFFLLHPPSFVMSLRILRRHHLDQVHLRVARLQPAEVELHVDFHLDQPLEELELRGRLMGPRCAYASTVEVAYHLRFLGWPAPKSGHIQGRIIIPEPSLWEPMCPHLYHGPLELWQAGQPLVQVQASIGLRHATLKQGLFWNGHLLPLHGRVVGSLNDASARELRHAGVNLVLVPPDEDAGQILEVAGRHGLLVLFHLTDPGQKGINLGLTLPHEPSWLGCLVRVELLEKEAFQFCSSPNQRGRLLGVELISFGNRPGVGNFICCPAGLLPAAAETRVPVLLRGRPEIVPDGMALLGYIEE